MPSRHRARCYGRGAAGLPAAMPAVAAEAAPPIQLDLRRVRSCHAGACTRAGRSARFDQPLAAHHAAPGQRQAAQDRRHRLVVDGRRRREFAAAMPIRAGLPPSSRRCFPVDDITVLNRGVNGEESARHAGAVRRPTSLPRTRMLVLWQVGTNSVLRDHPLESHAAGCTKASSELKAAGDRRGADRSAIRAEGSRQAETPRHGRPDRVTAKEEQRRSVPALRGDARLARLSTLPFEHVRLARRAAYERLGLWLLGQAPRRGIADAARRPIASAAASSGNDV